MTHESQAPEGGPDLRTAAQEALEALELYVETYNDYWESGMDILEPTGDRALAALRAALAAQPQPVGWPDAADWLERESAAVYGVCHQHHAEAAQWLRDTSTSAAQPAPSPAEGDANPWKAAIDEALVVNCLDCIGPDETAEQALARLIAWEVETALDPAVSERAAALQSQAQPKGIAIDPPPGFRLVPTAETLAAIVPVVGPEGGAAKRFDEWFAAEDLTGLTIKEVASLGFDAGHAFWHAAQAPAPAHEQGPQRCTACETWVCAGSMCRCRAVDRREESTPADFHADVYQQCCDAIKPLVDGGHLPGSVVESLQMLVAEKRAALQAPAVKDDDTARLDGLDALLQDGTLTIRTTHYLSASSRVQISYGSEDPIGDSFSLRDAIDAAIAAHVPVQGSQS